MTFLAMTVLGQNGLFLAWEKAILAIMKLQAYREARGLTLDELAKHLGVPGRHAGRTVRRWESGERTPRPTAMRRILQATAGQVGPADFFESLERSETVQFEGARR